MSRGCPLACLRRQKNSSMIKRLWPCFRSCLQPQTRHCRQMVGGKEGENGDRESETIKRAELMSKNKRDIYQRLKRLAIIRYLSFSFSSSSRTPQCGWLFPTCPLFSLHLHLQNFNLPQPSFPFLSFLPPYLIPIPDCPFPRSLPPTLPSSSNYQEEYEQNHTLHSFQVLEKDPPGNYPARDESSNAPHPHLLSPATIPTLPHSSPSPCL